MPTISRCSGASFQGKISMADASFLVTTPVPDRQPGPRALSSGNAPAWRKALEDAAWPDTFGATRPFGGGQSALGDLSNSGSLPEKTAQSPRPGTLVEPLVGQAMQVIPEAAKASDDTVPVASIRPRDAHDYSVRGTEAWSPSRQQVAERFTALQPASCSSGHLRWVGTRCPARNMTTTSQADGVAVWIRDAQVTPAQVMALLGPLRKSMGEVGAQVLRVSLNGFPVWSASQEAPVIPQVKE